MSLIIWVSLNYVLPSPDLHGYKCGASGDLVFTNIKKEKYIIKSHTHNQEWCRLESPLVWKLVWNHDQWSGNTWSVVTSKWEGSVFIKITWIIDLAHKTTNLAHWSNIHHPATVKNNLRHKACCDLMFTPGKLSLQFCLVDNFKNPWICLPFLYRV